jgi:ferric-dicitrate binding protein FerR (iron transport regulator)
MIPKDFHDRLQRSLSGELSEAEVLELHREILANPEALEEFLAARTMDHDLKRLLSPDSSDDAFLRGLLHARSSERKDPEAFVESVTRALTQNRKSTRRALPQTPRLDARPLLAAAAVLAAAVALWIFIASARRDEKEQASRPLPAPEPVRVEEPPREAARTPDPAPERPKESVPPSEPAPRPLPAPDLTPAPAVPAVPARAPADPPPSPPKPAPSPTVTAFATLRKAKGDVFIFSGAPSRKTPAVEGQPLAPGQGVLTEGGQSGVLVTRHDSTQLTLGPDTQIAFAAARAEIALFQGKLDVDAAQEVLFTTPHAEVRAQGSRFSLGSGTLSTSLEVQKGTALFTNVGDGKIIEVKPGQRVFAQEIPGIDRKRIDEAIHKGVAYLKEAPSEGIEVFRIANCDELILLTLLSAGIGENDVVVQKYLKNILSTTHGRTYLVALQAMVLEELDRVKYQDRIADCAQFLVDTQCTNGQWTYSGEASKAAPVAETPTGVATGAETPRESGSDLFGRRAKPTVVRKLQIKKTRSGQAQGDNSNSQYAALGLRACFEAGVRIPTETLQLASGWWRKCQYSEDAAARGVASGEGGPARGWCYHDGKNSVNGNPCCVGAVQSMTSGAVCSLIIYDHLLGTDWKKDIPVRLGMNWISTYYTVSRNLGIDAAFKAATGNTIPPETYHYYNLYALERVGVVSGQEKLGKHPWYADGAKYILGKQKADGSWSDGTQSSHPTWDTCFAILFLKRATRPLDVASVDRIPPKSPAEK